MLDLLLYDKIFVYISDNSLNVRKFSRLKYSMDFYVTKIFCWQASNSALPAGSMFMDYDTENTKQGLDTAPFDHAPIDIVSFYNSLTQSSSLCLCRT